MRCPHKENRDENKNIHNIYIYIYIERERERASVATYKKMKQINQKLKYYTHIFICYSYFTHTFYIL